MVAQLRSASDVNMYCGGLFSDGRRWPLERLCQLPRRVHPHFPAALVQEKHRGGLGNIPRTTAGLTTLGQTEPMPAQDVVAA